ncbi:hypothetical protein F183_A40110 [Bryobacterales bacterium F-183]|nr:hypothetical protein F183_A40110 [Bryobacterales bacterium F-183]
MLQLTSAAAILHGQNRPLSAAVRVASNKPTLHIDGKPVYACLYALTDCPGGRWPQDENAARSIRQFVDAGFRMFQVDLFLQEVWRSPDAKIDLEPARRLIRGITELCPNAAVFLRWHVNPPPWWMEQNPGELCRWANDPNYEKIEHTQHTRIIHDDLKRVPRVSLASEKWLQMAVAKTREFLAGLSKTREGNSLAGVQVACGVYGEWHYWAFPQNEPDVSEPMRRRFGKPVPGVAERQEAGNEAVAEYYRLQHRLVADCITTLCETVKKAWPRPIVTGTFYGYFFSMFNRQASGGHLELHRVLESPYVDYLSAPQAYGTLFRDLGGSGATRALVETIRLHGKLFLDEMDQAPSWQWRNNVDLAFGLTDIERDVAILRRNVLESYTRGAGLWFYDFGPANHTGWWQDTRLMTEIRQLKALLERYHAAAPYQPAGDVLYVFDTEVFYYTGNQDKVTDPLAVNQTIGQAYRSGAAIETIHVRDLGRVDLSRFKVVVLANLWRSSVVAPSGVKVLSQGKSPAEFRAVTAADLRKACDEAGAHLYTDREGDVVHAGGGLVLIHTKDGGPRRLKFRSGRQVEVTLPAKSSWIFDAVSGERLL